MEIGCKIKQFRFKSGLTQDQLAVKLGVSAQSISKWENAVTMPDISLLPTLAEVFGVTIDDLFDLTAEQRLRRIEHRLDTEEEIPTDIFREYEEFLQEQLIECTEKTQILSLLAHLYNHRMEADARRVSKYARESILLKPEKKDCQWLLQKAEGHAGWDWNIVNHTAAIEFYKDVIEHDTVTPQSPLPYYYVIDNLIADHRTKEAETYLAICQTLPAHKPFLIPIYKAHIALAEYDEERADAIMEKAAEDFSGDSGFLFETAQYFARKCEYGKAIEFYEANWTAEADHKPRFTDALQSIAIIYEIQLEYDKAANTYDRLIACLKEEWGYTEDDAAVRGVEREKQRVLRKKQG